MASRAVRCGGAPAAPAASGEGPPHAALTSPSRSRRRHRRRRGRAPLPLPREGGLGAEDGRRRGRPHRDPIP